MTNSLNPLIFVVNSRTLVGWGAPSPLLRTLMGCGNPPLDCHLGSGASYLCHFMLMGRAVAHSDDSGSFSHHQDGLYVQVLLPKTTATCGGASFGLWKDNAFCTGAWVRAYCVLIKYQKPLIHGIALSALFVEPGNGTHTPAAHGRVVHMV